MVNHKDTDKTSAATVNVTLSRKDLGRKRLKELMDEELRPVKGIFQNLECPGGTAHVVVRKFPGVPKFDKVMHDGQSYEVPLYVARHLNGVDKAAHQREGLINSCAYPVHSYSLEKSGAPRIDVGRWVRRFGFQSLEYA